MPATVALPRPYRMGPAERPAAMARANQLGVRLLMARKVLCDRGLLIISMIAEAATHAGVRKPKELRILLKIGAAFGAAACLDHFSCGDVTRVVSGGFSLRIVCKGCDTKWPSNLYLTLFPCWGKAGGRLCMPGRKT